MITRCALWQGFTPRYIFISINVFHAFWKSLHFLAFFDWFKLNENIFWSSNTHPVHFLVRLYNIEQRCHVPEMDNNSFRKLRLSVSLNRILQIYTAFETFHYDWTGQNQSGLPLSVPCFSSLQNIGFNALKPF